MQYDPPYLPPTQVDTPKDMWNGTLRVLYDGGDWDENGSDRYTWSAAEGLWGGQPALAISLEP